MEQNENTADRFLRLPAVMELTGLGRSFIYAAMQNGTFPKSLKIGPRAVAWRLSDLKAWMAEQRPAA